MKKMNWLLFAFSFVVIFAFITTSCYYDKSEVLYPSIGIECDTNNVTYSSTISGIISDNCNACHGVNYKTNGSNIRLDNYTDLTANIDKVIGAVNHNPAYSQMPKNTAKLSECKLKKLSVWFRAGAPNN